MVDEQHGDIPSGHRPVEQPAGGELDHIGDVRSDHVEAVSHSGIGGARSRANDSAYSLKTSVSGIEGFSSHVVSIPVMKAMIWSALTVTSMSRRYRPARWPCRIRSVMMSTAP